MHNYKQITLSRTYNLWRYYAYISSVLLVIILWREALRNCVQTRSRSSTTETPTNFRGIGGETLLECYKHIKSTTSQHDNYYTHFWHSLMQRSHSGGMPTKVKAVLAWYDFHCTSTVRLTVIKWTIVANAIMEALPVNHHHGMLVVQVPEQRGFSSTLHINIYIMLGIVLDSFLCQWFDAPQTLFITAHIQCLQVALNSSYIYRDTCQF